MNIVKGPVQCSTLMYIDNQCSSSADSFETKYCIVDQSTIPHYHHLHRKPKWKLLLIWSYLVYFGVIALNPQIHPESKFHPNPMFWDKELSGGYITCSVADKLIQSLLHVTAQGVGRVIAVCWELYPGRIREETWAFKVYVCNYAQKDQHKPILLPTPYQTGGLL